VETAEAVTAVLVTRGTATGNISFVEGSVMDRTKLLEPHLTRREIAEALGIHPRTVSRWVREGVLPPPIKFARHGAARWKRSAIEAALAKLAKGGAK
jgi:excisionase family DNA binding protein